LSAFVSDGDVQHDEIGVDADHIIVLRNYNDDVDARDYE